MSERWGVWCTGPNGEAGWFMWNHDSGPMGDSVMPRYWLRHTEAHSWAVRRNNASTHALHGWRYEARRLDEGGRDDG